jgi:hypothetical protein
MFCYKNVSGYLIKPKPGFPPLPPSIAYQRPRTVAPPGHQWHHHSAKSLIPLDSLRITDPQHMPCLVVLSWCLQ